MASNRQSYRATKSGLSRETQAKINAKYDVDLANMCLEWILETVNRNLSPGEEELSFETNGDQKNFAEVLKNGLVLGRMANTLLPGCIPASKLKCPPKMAFKQMELIELFIQKAREFGVPEQESFQTVDLYEEQNLHQVVICLQSLGRKAKAKGLDGFGPKEAEANIRDFSEDQLKAGQTIIGLQMGTNKGASQAGMNFGKHRKIID